MELLVRGFRDSAGLPPLSDRESCDDVLGRHLAALYGRGRAANPGIDVPCEAFGRCLARSAGTDTPEVLDGRAIEDLYLACACAMGVPGAAAVFEVRFARVIRRAVSRVLTSPTDREEAEQKTRRSLLVAGPEDRPKISQYQGQGPLESWVAVTAIRVAVSLGRSESAERRLRDRAANEAVGVVDPEALLMKQELRAQLEKAIESALGRLEDRERLVLRFYLVSGMTLAAIAKSFGVTQPTVSRWLVKARESVLSDVHEQLGEQLRVGRGDLNSLARLVGSQLDLSISRLLA